MNDPERTSEAPGDDRRERMQRVRVGLTGLAVVLMLVFVATMIFSRLQAPQAVNVSDRNADEPLADLGVAPGAPDNQADGNTTGK